MRSYGYKNRDNVSIKDVTGFKELNIIVHEKGVDVNMKYNQEAFLRYKRLLTCNTVRSAQRVLGKHLEGEALLAAFWEEQNNVLCILQEQMREILTAYIGNANELEVDKTTGGFSKLSVRALLKGSDKYNLIRYSTNTNEMGFKFSRTNFNLVDIDPSSLVPVCVEAKKAAKADYRQQFYAVENALLQEIRQL